MKRGSTSIFLSAIAAVVFASANPTCPSAHAQAASPASSGSHAIVITDIANWKHPTKAVFAHHSIKLSKVEIDEAKHAVFYVTMPFDPQTSANSATLNRLLADLLRANGWWGYALYDAQDHIRIDATWNKKKKRLTVDIVPLEETPPSN